MSPDDHFADVPGVVIAHSPAATGQYIGSPSLAILPDGTYVASHDLFGPGTNFDRMHVYQSADRGRSWRHIAELHGQWWSTLFMHQGALYLLGTSREYGHIVIRRSSDAGHTWTTPRNEYTGLLSATDRYHCAPVPVPIHKDRLWRAFELAHGERPQWPAQILSAPVDADLLKAENWQFSESYEHLWSGSQWIEGNVVITPENTLVDILRTNGQGVDKAALLHISSDGITLSHDREKDLVDFPGGVKFTIRYDVASGRYWSLCSKQKDPPAERNTLVLTSSHNLREWILESVVLHHPDVKNHAFQYVDWLFDDEDMVFVSRTACDDGLGGAHNYHDANFLTFHRIEAFRQRPIVPSDSKNEEI